MEESTTTTPKVSGHKPGYIFVIVLCVVAFVVAMFFTLLSTSQDIIPGVFITDVFSENISRTRNYLEITPASGAFSIWGFIYIYQTVFLAYAISTIFRKTSAGYMYCTMPLLPPIMFVIYILNLAINVGWLFSSDRNALQYGLLLICLLPSSLYMCMGISMNRLFKYAPDFIAEGKVTELKLVIGIVYNAFGLYAGWTTIATLLNLSIVLTYYLPGPVPQNVSSTIALSILTLEVIVYVMLEHVFLEKYLRHLYTPYISLHFALIGSVSRNWNPLSSNSIFTMGLLATGIVFTIFKVARSIYMEKKHPLFGSHSGNKVGSTNEKLQQKYAN